MEHGRRGKMITDTVCELKKPVEVNNYHYLDTRFDSNYGVAWVYVKNDAPPCFTQDLIYELRTEQLKIQKQAQRDLEQNRDDRLRYQVHASRIPGIFSLGGDLQLFQKLIHAKDRGAMFSYGLSCIDLGFNTSMNYMLPLTTIALVQGNAQGGGFEAALSANILIAERNANLGFPEILFNLFPGMGGISFLSRRLPLHKAEELISSGRNYSAEELHDIGIVDILADDGQGENAVWDFIRSHDRHINGHHAIRSAFQRVSALNRQELVDILEDWVDTAMKISSGDLKLMARLVRAQKRKVESG